jgi:hypothetical protein
MAARKKRKITKAHLRALQAGRKKYQKALKAKSNPIRRRKTAKRKVSTIVRKIKRRVARSRPNPSRWWRLRYKRGHKTYCAIGKGSHDSARKRAQAFADREGVKVSLCGPYPDKATARAACYVP